MQSIKNNKNTTLLFDLEIRLTRLGKLAGKRGNFSFPDRGQERVSFSLLHDRRVLQQVLQTCHGGVRGGEKKSSILIYIATFFQEIQCLKQSFTHFPQGVYMNAH